MSHSIEPFLDPNVCEDMISTVNGFIDAAYTRENAAIRKAYIYEYAVAMEVFAFALHCPGSPETDALPGFDLAELPAPLAELSERICTHTGIHSGRVLLNISRYPENCDEISPHHDGELFDFDVIPGQSTVVHSGLRPPEVALLTLRNDTAGIGTTLHDEDDKVTETCALAGELLRFDNIHYRHGVPATGSRSADRSGKADDDALDTSGSGDPRWIRYAIGWRALEQDCLFWENDGPRRPVSLAEAAAAQRRFLEEQWPRQREETLARGTFPFRSPYT